MMDNKLISIIVPIYNVEKYLNKCIDSITQQTYQNIEVILVDDGSPDRCGEICDEYAAKDKRIKVLHQKNAGVTEARIAGFEHSTGEYISFVDSDDYISDDYIEHLYGLVIRYKVEMVCCQYYNVYGEKLVPEIRDANGYFDKKRINNLLKTNFLFDYKKRKGSLFSGQCGKIMKRSLLSNALYISRGLKWGEDLTMLLYILYRIQSFYVSTGKKYYYVQHQGQTTRSGDISTWYNLVEHWKSLIELDTNRYLIDQLAYRVLRYIQIFMKNNLEMPISYVEFKQNMQMSLDNDIVREYFYNYQYKYLMIFDRVFVFFIKQKYYRLFYTLGKITLSLIGLIKNRDFLTR